MRIELGFDPVQGAYITYGTPTHKRNKGKSIIAFPSDYTIVDLETTGLSPDYDEIIEIAAIRVRESTIVNTFQSLVKPNNKVDEFITELTGITNDMLELAPSPEEIIPKFKDFIGQDIIVGHNVGFDINFMYDYIERLLNEEFSNNHINTMRISRKVLSHLKHHRLTDIAKELNVTSDTFHRALADCQITYDCYNHMHNLVLENYETEDNFISSFIKSSHSVDLRTITSQVTEFDETHALYGKVCVFTGKLDRMTRTEAAQKVTDLGGICENGITKKTNFLILGDTDYSKNIKDGKSSKHKKAEQYKLLGQDIEILPENIFYDLII